MLLCMFREGLLKRQGPPLSDTDLSLDRQQLSRHFHAGDFQSLGTVVLDP